MIDTISGKIDAQSLRNPDFISRILELFQGFAQVVCPDEQQDRWVFRGVAKASHSLQPSIARGTKDRVECCRVEEGLYRRFRKLALMHLSGDDLIMLREATTDVASEIAAHGRAPETAEEYIYFALMQHFGVPTRLLDWSESPWIALYFAAMDAPTEDGCVYALDCEQLKEQLPDSAKVPIRILQERERADADAVQVVKVPHAFRRIANQLGLFTMAEDPTRDQKLILKSKLKRGFLEMKIQADLKPAIRRLLQSMNIRHSTVYPCMLQSKQRKETKIPACGPASSVAKKSAHTRPAVDRGTLGLASPKPSRIAAGLVNVSPNSRQNRRTKVAASSHSQGRALVMDLVSFVGVDVSKQQLDVAVLPVGQKFAVPRTRSGYQQLLAQLPEAGACHVVLEATGGYEREVVAELLSQGHLVSVVNPRQVRDFARALGVLAKTDEIDARVLARFGELVKPRPCSAASPQLAELQQLVDRRRQLLELRTAESNRLEQCTAKMARKSIQKMIETMQKQIAALEAEIARLVESDDDWKRKAEVLISVPGVGDVTAAALIADLPELGQLNRCQIASLVGLAPYNHDSGKLKGQRAIGGGRATVRTSLYMAALSAMRYNPVLQAFSQRLAQNGKKFKVRITACMRKLLVILNTMVKNNQTWSTSKI